MDDLHRQIYNHILRARINLNDAIILLAGTTPFDDATLLCALETAQNGLSHLSRQMEDN